MESLCAIKCVEYLVCTQCNLFPQPGNEEGIPIGTYTGTCGGCRVSEDALKLLCSHCLNTEGAYVPAEAELSACKQFANDNGKLACAPVEAPVPEAHPEL